MSDKLNNTAGKTGFTDLWNIDIGDWFVDLGNPLILVVSALLLISLVLTLHTCWRRLRPGKPARAVMVALLNLIAFTTLLVILVEPQRLHLAKQDVILLTEGADMTSASLLDATSVYLSPGIVATDESLRMLKNASTLKNANWLLDIAQLPMREPALSGIDVRGFGLSRTQWQSLPKDIRVDFKAPSVNGFTGMHWPRTLVTGETLHIGGRYTNQAVDTVIILRLLDPAGSKVDETRVRNEDNFSLSARPRTRGNLAYTLQAWSGDALLSEQPVTTSVQSTPAITIMVEQSAPSFETRQLKNYAAGNGAQVLINTQISRGKSISQSVNLPDNAEITFSPQTLAAQDLLIMDGRALVLLADRQRQWLANAVEGGLGLLVLADSTLLEEFKSIKSMGSHLFRGFELTPAPNIQTEPVPRLLSNTSSGWQQALPVAAMQVQAIEADVLIDDGHGQALVLNRSSGLGHIAISLISQSHRWLTSGNRQHWSDYWAALIAAIGRPRSSNYLLPQTDAGFFRPGIRTPVCAMSNTENVMVTINSADADNMQQGFDISLTPDALGSPRQCGWYWPQQSGWHQIQLRQANLHNETEGAVAEQQGVYIFEQNQWLSNNRHERIAATRQRSSDRNNPAIEASAEKWVSEPLNIFWLWSVLVISASLLWLERKLDFTD